VYVHNVDLHRAVTLAARLLMRARTIVLSGLLNFLASCDDPLHMEVLLIRVALVATTRPTFALSRWLLIAVRLLLDVLCRVHVDT